MSASSSSRSALPSSSPVSFLANRDRVTGFATTFFDRIGGELRHAGSSTKSVTTTRSTVRGVVGSAIAESMVAAFGYWLAGVPAWALLGGLTFFAALVQIGAPLVWIPVAIWLFAENELAWAIFMVVWGAVVVYSVENFSRPILAGKASHLPGPPDLRRRPGRPVRLGPDRDLSRAGDPGRGL